MIIDPEDRLAANRGESRRSAKTSRQLAAARPRHAADASEPPAAAPTAVDLTMAALAKEREGSVTARGRMWLARYRSDRRSLAEIALESGATVDDVRAGIDAALTVEGSSFAEFTAARRRPRPAPGRGPTPLSSLVGSSPTVLPFAGRRTGGGRFTPPLERAGESPADRASTARPTP